MNGLLVLSGDKSNIPTLAYRLLHTVLTHEGVLSSGPHKEEWKVVLKAVNETTGFEILNFFSSEVEVEIAKINFKKQVAVCDTESGSHSVLLSGRSGEWIEGFDPD